MDDRIKLLSSFVIKILCSICKGKISTFVVFRGGKKDLVEMIISLDSHCHCFRELYYLKCGRLSVESGEMAVTI